MIEVKFEELALTIFTLAFLSVFFLQISYNSRQRKLRKRAKLQIVQCPVCGEVFEDKTQERMPECPGCGRKTLRGNDRSLG